MGVCAAACPVLPPGPLGDNDAVAVASKREIPSQDTWGPTMEGEGPAGSAGVRLSREEGLAPRNGSSLLLKRPRPQAESDKNRVGVEVRGTHWS